MKKTFLIVAILLLCGSNMATAQITQDSNYNLRLAVELCQNNDFQEAMVYLKMQLEETPKNADVYYLRAYIYNAQRKFDIALADINDGIKYYKKGGLLTSYAFYKLRAWIYSALGRNDDAINDYEIAIKNVKKENPDAIYEILQDRANGYYNMGEYDKSDGDYKLILKHDENNYIAMLGLTRNMMARKDYSAAINIANRCARYYPEIDGIYYFRMQLYDEMGQRDKAIDDAVKYIEYANQPDEQLYETIFRKHIVYARAKIYEQINKTGGDIKWRLLRVRLHELIYDYTSAIKEYNAMESDYGADEQIYLRRSKCYNKIGDIDKAAADITQYIEMRGGNDFYGIATRADYYREAGMYKEAIADFTRGIELQPMIAFCYYKRGWSYELSGNDDKAMMDYDAGIDIEKDSYYTYLMRGELFLKRGDIAKAKTDFETVLQLDTIAKAGITCRQYALHFLGRDEEALEWMDKIIADSPTNNGVYYDQACLFGRMNRLQESVAALRKAFEFGYRSFAHIEHDDDMDPIRELPEFKALIEEYKSKPIIIEE